MNAVKKLVYNYVIPALGRVMVGKNKYVNVIYYHDIVDGESESFMRTNIDLFKRQMQYIADQGFETVRFDDLQNEDMLKFKKKRVLIAFDDGWLSNYSKIFEWMKERGIKYNIYLAMNEIGNNPEYLTWDQVREMHDSGLCGFGAHTFSHPDMSDITKIDPNLEFDKADELFEKELGYRPVDFCYPFGYYSEASNQYILDNTNYKRIYTSAYMYSYEQNGKIVFGRNGISGNEAWCVFVAKLNGWFNVWKTVVH